MVDVLVTGGAGFIGSNFVRYALATHPDWRVTTLDKLTYAGRLENLHDVLDDPRHQFVRGDVCDPELVGPLVRRSEIVVHFAAETHVDRAILAAGDFILTDVYGTFVLLEAARGARHLRRFIQVSTDEVYGSVKAGASRETDELKP
ncbi:MAG: NAD-dependent epimerase/dehydratase family protein, partial [Acidobacteria bacterium]